MTIKTWAVSLGAAIIGWFGIQVFVMYFTDAAPVAVALFPSAALIASLPQDVSVVGGGANWIAARSDAPDLGKSLYAAGALVFLPAGLPGCLPLLKS